MALGHALFLRTEFQFYQRAPEQLLLAAAAAAACCCRLRASKRAAGALPRAGN
jgi:hypothetical protein